MGMVRIHVTLVDDLRGRVFTVTSIAAPVEWIIDTDPLRLEPSEREHLLRMAQRDATQSCSRYDVLSGTPPADVWIGAYAPRPNEASVSRKSQHLPLDVRGDDAVVVAVALASFGFAEDGAVDGATVDAAAIRADHLRRAAAYAAAREQLDAVVESWIAEVEAQIADLRARGGAGGAAGPGSVLHAPGRRPARRCLRSGVGGGALDRVRTLVNPSRLERGCAHAGAAARFCRRPEGVGVCGGLGG